MFKFKSKCQGEIFGIALLFVIIIVGLILSAQVDLVMSDNDRDPVTKGKYELLAQSSLETILKTTTKCNVDGNSGMDTVQDLINTCLARTFNNRDPVISCPEYSAADIQLCATALNILNNTLKNLYNGSDSLIGNIPYLLEIDLPSNARTPLSNKTLTNFGEVKTKDKIINQSNYPNLGFNKASSDLKPWATAQRSIKVTLALYYK